MQVDQLGCMNSTQESFQPVLSAGKQTTVAIWLLLLLP